MVFQPATTSNVLAILTPECYLHLYDIEGRTYTEWSRTNAADTSRILKRMPNLVSMCFVPHNPSRLLLWGHAGFVVMDITQPLFGKIDFPKVGGESSGKKRKAPLIDESAPVVIDEHAPKTLDCGIFVDTYKPLLHLSFSNNSLLVVERPWLKVLESLPDTVVRPRYGT
eukprot:TRINITY_DN6391_c0_g1::TRINITY_DN6391_c0_g1_i1::g.577::m.577 TRINITY_DN6391_c0_g1::TRINITY_DN6391_c0_g1_i1::g.577  ORF type:complete len:196 (+),score=41.40,sp/Q8R2N2/UTP4_MOUSE/26.15/2e-06 TRINITY_DN6391_c0_g1_i1:83-589(+)